MDPRHKAVIARIEGLIESLGRPEFDKEKNAMAALIAANQKQFMTPDGSFRFEDAYRLACRLEKLGDHWFLYDDMGTHGIGFTVRDAIMAAWQQQRRAGRG